MREYLVKDLFVLAAVLVNLLVPTLMNDEGTAASLVSRTASLCQSWRNMIQLKWGTTRQRLRCKSAGRPAESHPAITHPSWPCCVPLLGSCGSERKIQPQAWHEGDWHCPVDPFNKGKVLKTFYTF